MKYGTVVLMLMMISLTKGSDCDSVGDCFSCTRKSSWIGTCRWCPLDFACHAYGSLANPCKVDQNIKDSRQCYDKTIGEYNSNSAYVNTLLSAVAYSADPQNCADRILSDSGFRLVESIGRKCDQHTIFDYEHCYAYTAVSDSMKLIVVAFKGTAKSLAQLWDEAGTVLLRPKTSFRTGGEVQVYFYDTFNLFYSCIKGSLASLTHEYPEYDVVVTGHSLGGALASLTAASLIYDSVLSTNKMSLYTFGMPRVGDKDYALAHDKLVKNSWRVVHYKDIVAHLPTCNLLTGSCAVTNGPFHHGTEVFYNVIDMTVNSTYKICHGDEDESCSDGIISDCFPTYANCIKYHKEYFGIRVGTYCDERKSGKRSVVQEASFWSEFPEDKCVRIPFERNGISSKSNTSFSSEDTSVAASAFYNDGFCWNVFALYIVLLIFVL